MRHLPSHSCLILVRRLVEQNQRGTISLPSNANRFPLWSNTFAEMAAGTNPAKKGTLVRVHPTRALMVPGARTREDIPGRWMHMERRR